MPGTTSSPEPSWSEQVAQVVMDAMVQAANTGEAEKAEARHAADLIQKLNAPIDPKATLIGSEAGHDLLTLLVAELKRRLSTPSVVQQMSAGEMEMVRKLLTDNSVTLASIRRGDFGETAQRVATEYPFPEGTRAETRQ